MPIVFNPAVGWAWLGLLGAAALFVSLPALLRRGRGGLPRTFGFLLLLGILAAPSLVAETRRPLPDIAILLVDQSQSMALGGRAAEAAEAASALRASAGTVELHSIAIPPGTTGGTQLFAALHDALTAIPPDQLAGIVAVTDGEVSDPPTGMAGEPPFTALLTARHEETDRELRLVNSPNYGLVGKTVRLQLEVLDHGSDDDGRPAAVTVTEDGQALASQTVTIGTPATFDLPVRHAGPNIVQAAVATLPGEVSPINNQVIFTLNGIQRRLNVLLISGSPDLGERSWRLLLKSDPATQLVDFTILRAPGETIDAEPADLALVPFPVEKLFETDIGKFDLIILDRFRTVGLLPAQYLANIAAYVENGGALLAEFGPDFDSSNSLAYSPLGEVLPAQPIDPGTLDQEFVPTVTAIGARHPVTAPFAGAALAPWFRMETAAPTFGDVLMTGAGNAPLLILGTVGAGRVGMLLSDQFWLWTRGGSHAGPALPMLGRMVHWLLREPGLEAESLSARFENRDLLIERQTLALTDPGDVNVVAPNGVVSRLHLRQAGPGRYSATVAAASSQRGVWKITEGNRTAYAANPIENAAEYQDLAATATLLRPVAHDIVWLGRQPAPPLAQLIRPRHASAVTGTRAIPLLPPLPAALVALALFSAAWWREAF